MFVQSFFVPGLAHLSYLLGGKNTCAIVDPRRDVEEYLSWPRNGNAHYSYPGDPPARRLRLWAHGSGNRTGGNHCPQSGKMQLSPPTRGEGDEFQIEDMIIRVLDTPGHTPEHITYAVIDSSREQNRRPSSAGHLVCGDVGRPDLFPAMPSNWPENYMKAWEAQSSP